MEIVIFGSGNVAWSLGRALNRSGHKVIKIISRNSQSGLKLASELSSEFVILEDLNFSFKSETISFICFPDDVLKEIGTKIRINNGIAVHTAGSVSMNVLNNVSNRIGVFYPLQTLKFGIEVQNQYPILIDASDLQTLDILQTLAASLSDFVHVAKDSDREKVHLAAVMVNNFVNHLFTLIFDYCKAESLPFELFMPLLKETIHRIEKKSPFEIQTGPAIRNDLKTIKRHQQMMEEYTDLKKIYSIFTDSIQNYHHHKNKN